MDSRIPVVRDSTLVQELRRKGIMLRQPLLVLRKEVLGVLLVLQHLGPQLLDQIRRPPKHASNECQLAVRGSGLYHLPGPGNRRLKPLVSGVQHAQAQAIGAEIFTGPICDMD